MQTTLTETGRFERTLTIQIPSSDLEEAKDKAARRLAQEVKVPGFRPGKAPRPMVERAVGAERLQSEALEEALPEIVGTALEEAELSPATAPAVADTRDIDDGLEVDVRVTLWPTLDTVPAYDGRRVEIETASVTDEDIDTQIERLRYQFAELEDVGRPAEAGDFALIDLTARRGGTTIDDRRRPTCCTRSAADPFFPVSTSRCKVRPPERSRPS